MVRIANVELPTKSRVVIALQKIYGIGNTAAHKVCKDASIDLAKKLNSLEEDQLAKLRTIIDNHFIVEGDLRKEVALNIKRKKDIKCYQGMRHLKKLPVRGQNTRCNARTRKGKAVAIAGKKKSTSKK
jgi:small subunit ribosomal protein S13